MLGTTKVIKKDTTHLLCKWYCPIAKTIAENVKKKKKYFDHFSYWQVAIVNSLDSKTQYENWTFKRYIFFIWYFSHLNPTPLKFWEFFPGYIKFHESIEYLFKSKVSFEILMSKGWSFLKNNIMELCADLLRIKELSFSIFFFS